MSTPSATTVTVKATLNLPSSLGNVRPLAESITQEGATQVGSALTNLQDQIDQLVSALKSQIKVTATATPTPGSNPLRIAGAYPWATKDPPTPIAVHETLRHPNFGLKSKKLTDINGASAPQFLLTGRAVVNKFSAVTQAPVVSLSTTSVGGTLPGDVTYNVMVWAVDAAGEWTAGSLASIYVPPGTNTNTVGVTVTFFDPTNDSGWVVISPLPAAGWYGPNATAIAVGHTAYTFTAIGDLNTPVPDELFDHYRVDARTAYMLGVSGAPCSAISGGGTTIQFTGYTWGVNQLVGRNLSAYFMKDPTQPLPIIDIPILSNTADTVVVGESVTAKGMGVGDGFLISTLADSFGPNSIGDTSLRTNNVEQPAGPPVNGYVGDFIAIIKGTGLGTSPVPIAANTAAGGFTTAAPFDVTPDATSVFIVISGTIAASLSSPQMQYSALTADTGVKLSVTVPNQWNHYFVQVFTVSIDGIASDVRWSPWRQIFTPGFSISDANGGLGPPQFSVTVGYGSDGSAEDIPVFTGGLTGQSETKTVDIPGTPYAYRVKGDVGPAGGDTVFGLYVKKGGSAPTAVFLSGPPTFPNGTAARTDVVVTGIDPATVLHLDVGDRVFLQVDSIAPTPGQRAVVDIWWRDIPATATAQ